MPDDVIKMSENATDVVLTPQNWFFAGKGSRCLTFKVPVYQRLFAWKEPQFERLLTDLDKHFCMKKQEASGKILPYYLGIITVVKKVVDDKTQYILVDGQQRLTVIAILASMLDENANLEISNFLDYEARPDDRKALQNIASNGKNWLADWKEWSPAEREKKLNEKLDEACVVSESMRMFVLYIAKERNKWEILWGKNIKSSLTLLISILPETYEKDVKLQNEYFEKMNSSGKQLEPHEILKVQLCHNEKEFDTWNAIEDFTKKFINSTETKNSNDDSICLIKAIDNSEYSLQQRETNLKKTSIEKWRPSLIDFPMFLLHVLKLILDETDKDSSQNGYHLPADSHKLLEAFGERKDKWDFLKKMKEYRMFLDEWIIHKEVVPENSTGVNDSDFDGDNTGFKYWGADTAETVFLTHGKSGKVSPDNEEVNKFKALKQIQMSLYALDGSNQPWLVEAFNCLKTQNEEEKALALYRCLLVYLIEKTSIFKIFLKNVPFPQNEKYNLKCWYTPLRYFLTNTNDWQDPWLTFQTCNHADFVCLDFFLWLLANSSEEKLNDEGKELKDGIFGKKIPEAITKFIPRANRSVEHFHPQTDSNSCHTGPKEDNASDSDKPGWGATISPDDKNSMSIKDIFGNLALISVNRNSEYSNFTVNEKSARIRKRCEQKSLESIKLWIMANKSGGQDNNWTPTLAREHANDMLNVIKWGLCVHEPIFQSCDPSYEIKAQAVEDDGKLTGIQDLTE